MYVQAYFPNEPQSRDHLVCVELAHGSNGDDFARPNSQALANQGRHKYRLNQLVKNRFISAPKGIDLKEKRMLTLIHIYREKERDNAISFLKKLQNFKCEKKKKI